MVVEGAAVSYRVGMGVDAHALEPGVPLVLGGVPIDHPAGLAGHSDGDVLAHALIDALLGAAGLGDIGSLFPSGDETLRGVSSLHLLTEAYRQVTEAGWQLVNADCILIGEEPRVAETLVRDELVAVQTPQAFVAAVLRAAIAGEGSDCASLVEANGGRVAVVAGDERLLKVTTTADLERVAAWLSKAPL